MITEENDLLLKRALEIRESVDKLIEQIRAERGGTFNIEAKGKGRFHNMPLHLRVAPKDDSSND